MTDERALKWRLALWIALVVSIVLSVALPGGGGALFTIGGVNIFANDLLIVCALVLGTGELLRSAADRDASFSRSISRLLIAYLLYEVLVVIPVAMWLDGPSLVTVVRAMGVRFDWVFFPVLLTLFRDRRMRRTASMVLLAGAAVLALWGVYLALTGGGGYYYEAGEGMRYRILGALALPVFGWPIAVAVAGVVPTLASVGLAGLAVVGQTLTGFRSGMVAMGVAALAGLAASKRLMRVVAWAIPVALLALMVYAVWGDRLGSVYGYTVSHLLDMGSATGADRMRRWGLAWDFIRTHPFNDYVWSWQRYLLHLTAGYEPHNFVLEVGTTEGIAGFVFYAAILATAARTAWKHLRDDAQTRALACFLLLYVVFSTGNTNWYSYDSLPLFVAVIAALAARADSLRHDSARLPVTGEIAGT